MKEVTRTFYKCDYCSKEFESKEDCLMHERYSHLCLKCDHCFFLYGSEQMCDSKRRM